MFWDLLLSDNFRQFGYYSADTDSSAASKTPLTEPMSVAENSLEFLNNLLVLGTKQV
jgi:hypothetical protein